MGDASRRGTYEERKAAAIARDQHLVDDWNTRIEEHVKNEYATYCTKHPDMTDDDREKLRKGLAGMAEHLKTQNPLLRRAHRRD